MLTNIEHTKGIVVADFWAPWCGPCRMLSPILDEIKQKNPEIEIIKVNVDENEEWTQRYNIQNVPTLIFFKDGKQIERTNGLKSESEILEIINRKSLLTF